MFFAKFLHYLITVQNKEFWEDYYSLWNTFRKVIIFLNFGQFWYTLQKSKLIHRRCLGLITTHFKLSFASLNFSFKFRSVFVHYVQNKTHESFLSKFHHYLILGKNKEFREDYYSLWNKFRKVTIFLNFRSVFVQFAKNQTQESLRSFGLITTHFKVSVVS